MKESLDEHSKQLLKIIVEGVLKGVLGEIARGILKRFFLTSSEEFLESFLNFSEESSKAIFGKMPEGNFVNNLGQILAETFVRVEKFHGKFQQQS